MSWHAFRFSRKWAAREFKFHFQIFFSKFPSFSLIFSQTLIHFLFFFLYFYF
ncbi:hypothetical protein ACMBCN_00930 [Candidatus Liberibacter asiaticus]|nr:hypothetical protein [Candidatus Liberibacter asiaticus]